MNTRFIAPTALLALGVLGITGCADPEMQPRTVPVAATQRDNAGPPPPPRAEMIPPAPSPYATWAPGYWKREGATYAWVNGQWNDPRPTQVYVNAYWSQDNGVWAFHEGHWVASRAPAGTVAVISTMQPPPLKTETVPAAPGSDYLWVSGNWRWQNNSYVWFPGHWEQYRYQSGQVWVPEHWETAGTGQYQLVGGYWQQM